jgi:hypothetical protein
MRSLKCRQESQFLKIVNKINWSRHLKKFKLNGFSCEKLDNIFITFLLFYSKKFFLINLAEKFLKLKLITHLKDLPKSGTVALKKPKQNLKFILVNFLLIFPSRKITNRNHVWISFKIFNNKEILYFY